MEPLKKNTQLKLMDGKGTFIVSELLGEGGQGQVYRGTVNGKECALKYYSGGQRPAFRKNMEENIRLGAPAPQFVWPQAVTTMDNGRYGYIMDLLDSDFMEFTDYLLAKTHFESWGAVCNAALGVAFAFRELHRRGLSYQDLNDGNFAFHPKTGEVRIMDNDNVAPSDTNLGILGKARYMAPEVTIGKRLPNLLSDYYSMAVILFMVLCGGHPLEGENICKLPCLNDEVERTLYGKNPIFVYSDSNTSNRPVSGIHTNIIRRWPLMPRYIQEAFKRSFSPEALFDPNRRMTDNEWVELLCRLRTENVQCSCGSDFFFDIHRSSQNCPICGRSMQRPLILKGAHFPVLLSYGKKVYASDIMLDSNEHFEVVGTVRASRRDPSIWGLVNMSKETWSASYKTQTAVAAPKSTLVLLNGIKSSIGEIKNTL